MEDALQRIEKAWAEMDQDARAATAEALNMPLVRHARSLWLRNQELEAVLEKAEETLRMVCGQISVGADVPDETLADFSFKKTDQIFSTFKELTALKKTQHDMAT